MNFKKIIILSLLAVTLFGCISTVSAGWFDGKQETKINVEQVSTTGNIEDATPRTLVLYLSSSDKRLDGKDVEVTVVEDGNSSKEYKVFTSSTNRGQGTAEVCTLKPGHSYDISAVFKGDEKYEACNLTNYSISTVVI